MKADAERGAKRDPLRPSARRVVALLVGGVSCLLTFGIGIWIGLLPLTVREWRAERLISRALRCDTSIDFGSVEWYYGSSVPTLANPLDGLSPEVLPLLGVAGLIGSLLLVIGHIAIVHLAAWLAVRADRRLGLGVGIRPVKAMAASALLPVLLWRLVPTSLILGVAAGWCWMGTSQEFLLESFGLRWFPYAASGLCLLALPAIDLRFSLGAVRRLVQHAAPPRSQICNSCAYSLHGLRADTEACPECGQLLEANRLIVSLVMSPRVARGFRVAMLLLVGLAAGISVPMIWRSPEASRIASNWLLARSVLPRALPIVPNGAVVRIDDGVEQAYVAVWSAGPRRGGTLTRLRAIEPVAPNGSKRVDVVFPSWEYGSTHFVNRPAVVPAAYPFRTGSSELLAYSATGRTLCIRFVGREDIAEDDWTWLTAPLP